MLCSWADTVQRAVLQRRLRGQPLLPRRLNSVRQPVLQHR